MEKIVKKNRGKNPNKILPKNLGEKRGKNVVKKHEKKLAKNHGKIQKKKCRKKIYSKKIFDKNPEKSANEQET